TLGDTDARLGAVDMGYRTARAWWFPARHAGAIEDRGVQQEAGRTFDLVRITPEGGRAFTLWVDRQTHLIDRDIEQQAEQLRVTRYADYRRVGDLTLPFVVRDGDGDAAFDRVYTVTRIDPNAPVPDDAYSIPPAPAASTVSPSTTSTSTTVPFRFEDNRIVMSVMVDGKGPFDCELDSGGSLILSPTIVADLHLTLVGKTKETGGGEGFVTSGTGLAQHVSIGTAGLNDQIFNSFAWNSQYPRRMLMGQELLQHYVIRIDFDRLTMTLTTPDAFHYQGDGVVVPFHFQDNQPELVGAADGIAGNFAVDTGDSGSLLLIAPFARHYGLAERYHATIPYGGHAIAATHGVLTRVGKVTIDGADGRPALEVEKPLTRISLQQGGFDANRYVSGNLGIGILKQYNITFDYDRRQIIFEKNHLYGTPDPFDRSGFKLIRKDAGWVVDAVYPGGPADHAGIRTGDVVSRIDGKTSASLSADDQWALMRQPVGSVIKFDVRSGATERDVPLTLQDVL
ncbi:MAG TPA: PDZ domain-containing protein, partial [Xanthomonadaceae bacterium]|nr:PDZ domain-containing protein [Xanthomonadaceae bacterium]